MHSERVWTGSSRTLAVLLLALVVPPAVMLVWLGVRLLQQDRSLLAQREMERRAAVATAAVHTLETALADAERRIGDDPVPDGTVRLTFTKMDVEVQPVGRVSWLPVSPPMRAAENAHFADAEALEFQRGAARALSIYQQMAGSPDQTVRAGALFRAARIHRLQRQWDAALREYQSLAAIRDVAIAESPADLQARRAACSVLEEAGHTTALTQAAQSLEADLVAGHWLLDRASWELAAADIARWTGRAFTVDADRSLLSEVAAELWNEHQRGTWPGSALSGQRLVAAAGHPRVDVGHPQTADASTGEPTTRSADMGGCWRASWQAVAST
jgi:hypothetical protein